MRLLILLQVFVAIVEICISEDKTDTTILLNDSQTKLTIERDKNPNGSSSSELFDNYSEVESDGNDLNFDYDDGEDTLKADIKNPEQEMQEVLLKAMTKPAIRKQIGEVIPILRVMSPAQRLTLAALVSSQITSQNTLSEKNLIEMAETFANKNIENTDNRYNITEHLLLPISMDIAKMFKGLGKETGRNLRQDFHGPIDFMSAESSIRREIRKPYYRNQLIVNRRMDDYDHFEELSPTIEPVAEALKQPGRDECDYFTKSLCLEVSNYPTEAIISSIKKNQDIANTFLTDFEMHPPQENEQRSRSQGTGHRLERRQDDQNEVQDFIPNGGYMCPSSVKYARPKRARATSGQWKYIVNAGDYTQTLRLEICQKPKSPCSYVTNHLNSQCTQIYNYHRLLTWDESKGLHMDIFKVPSCCSCHIQGYSTFFPPNKDFTFAEKRREPLEGADYVPEPHIRPPYGYLGNKREVSNDPNRNLVPGLLKNHSHQVKDFYRNPVDHLVPPGPPLPLEKEDIFNIYSESSQNQKKLPVEQNRRYPVQAEYRRTVSKVSEGNDPLQELILPSDPRLNEPNIKFNKAQLSDIISSLSLEKNPIFDSKNQIQLLKPSPVAPPSFTSLETLKGNPSDTSLFVTPNLKDLIFQSGPKVNPKQPSQYFKSDKFSDTKTLASGVKPSYVTPPKVRGVESRISTTSAPPQKSELFTTTGQKKINYNYHPIIDFFLSDSKKTQPIYSTLQYRPLAPQDWTPVLGH